LGWGLGDIGYTKREEGKDDTVMRRHKNGVSIQKIRVLEVKEDMGDGGGYRNLQGDVGAAGVGSGD
jgi:hypothetical protein